MNTDDLLGFALEVSRVGIWDLDLVNRASVRSAEHDRIFGYKEPLPEWTYETFIEHVLESERAAVEEKFRYAMKNRNNWDFDCRIRRGDGEIRCIWTAGLHIYDVSGKALRMAGIVQDITAHKQSKSQYIKTEMALRESEEKFRVLADASPAAIIVYKGSRHVYVNPTAVTVLGYSEKKLLEMNFLDALIHPDDRQMAKEHVEKRMQGKGGKAHYELRVITKSRAEKWLDVFSGSIRYGGNPAGIVICLDITERKRAEELLKHDKDAIETLAQERTKQLVEAQIELEKTKRLSDIGVLAATVAHELRNPLAAIGIAVHNIKRKANNPALDIHLASINKKISESDQIINNLLFYSRLKTPNHDLVHLDRVIAECLSHLPPQTQAGRNIAVRLDLRQLKDEVIEADPLQLKEVFGNILNNSRDAFAGRDGMIKITGINGGKFVKIQVEDNGIGVNPEVLEKVFDPFFTTKAKGTGLGLTVCRQIVEMHGGSIGIASKPPGGTIISIILPKRRNGNAAL